MCVCTCVCLISTNLYISGWLYVSTPISKLETNCKEKNPTCSFTFLLDMFPFD